MVFRQKSDQFRSPTSLQSSSDEDDTIWEIRMNLDFVLSPPPVARESWIDPYGGGELEASYEVEL